MSATSDQFRKRVIRSSLFPKTSLSSALQRMVFVQADPIRTPARAQDLILRHRVKDYRAGDLEAKYPKLPLEEYYLFAYGIGTRDLWKHIYPKQARKLSGSEEATLAEVKKHGSIHPQKLEKLLGTGKARNGWGGVSRKAKLTLESLQHQGDLRIHRREKGIRVYAIAQAEEASLPKRERFKVILLAALRSMGPTGRKFLMSELRHFKYLEATRSGRLAALEELVSSGHVRVDQVDAQDYFSASAINPSRIALDQVRILAPFDPIVRDRERFQHLWGWEYRFEAYTPPAKRKLGYYAMPVIWRDAIIGWVNANVNDRKLSLEFGYVDRQPDEPDFQVSAQSEAASMAEFLRIEPTAVTTNL